MDINLPAWLQHTLFIGREGDEDLGNEGDDSANDGEEVEDEDQEIGTDDSGNNSEQDAEATALRKALNEERKLRRKAEREARLAKKGKDKETEDKTVEALQQQLTESTSKTERLAARLLSTELEKAITSEATRQKFIDPTDALNDEVRNQIEYDQDPEDPADIEIDFDTVRSAVTKLANRKKHLIGKPLDGEPTGGRFNNKKDAKSDEQTSDAALIDQYPSLR